MDFIKQTLNNINTNKNTLYDIIYDLFFLAQLKESEQNIKSGKICSLEDLKQHIDGLEARHANNNI